MTDQISQTQALLAAIPALAAELPQYLTARSLMHTDGDGFRNITSSSKPPIDVGLLDLILGRDLEWWVMLAIDEMIDEDIEPVDAPSSRTPSIADNCAWLAANSPWIAEQNSDYDNDIRRLHNDYQRAARIPRQTTYTCDRCGWNVEPRDDNAWFACTGCNRTWTLAAEIDRLMQDQESVMTLGKIADQTGISHPTLRRWKAQGRITPVGAKHGRPLYDIRHIRQAAERTKETA